MATTILGFKRISLDIAVGDLAPRQASLSPYNYQNTPKRVARALAEGKGKTNVRVILDGVTYYGGLCSGRDVGEANAAKPGVKYNVFFAIPQAEKTHERNTYVDENGQTVNHRTDWIPITAEEHAALRNDPAVALVATRLAPVTPVAAPKVDPVVEVAAPVAAPKGKRAKRQAVEA